MGILCGSIVGYMKYFESLFCLVKYEDLKDFENVVNLRIIVGDFLGGE